VAAAEQQSGGQPVARLDQVGHLDLDAGEGRVEVLVEGDDAGLVHRLLRHAAEHDVVRVEIQVAAEIAGAGPIESGPISGRVAVRRHGGGPNPRTAAGARLPLPSPSERP
jgi:hypothetical protein